MNESLNRALRSNSASLLAPLFDWRLWTTLGWLDMVQTYRRTSLGPWWITANLAVFVIAMTYVYGALFGIPTKEYSAYLLGGMIAWYWVSALLAEVGNAFINYTYFIRSTSIAKAQLVWATVYKQLLTFLHNSAIVIVYIVVGVIPLNFHTLAIIPAVALLFLLSIPTTAIAAILFARYRDLQRFIGSAVIIVMMLTPVFWKPDMMVGWRSAFVELNPFHYLIELIRRPLLGQPVDLTTYAVVIGLTVLAWLVGGRVFRRYQSYVIFWV
ncbi:ABC transporter permease [Pseudolabrys sp. FHR47]|uniref:ABC transporter permease n=1 Tax=Pseudolabrys sp. FHR47 TaxID=2562284 RepID=UPI0010BF055C|nr:ABC transporter permease [Pseudolabrys sp. FHR47]